MTNEEIQETKEGQPEETPKASNLVESATEAAQRLEEANKELAALLSKQEEILAREALGGRSEAGTAAHKAEPETDKEFAKRFLNGDVDILA